MKPEIAANKIKVEVGANENLKSDTMKLLDMLIEAAEIEAAYAITNVFIRVSGSDLDIAKKQQDVIRLREDQKKAEKIVATITAEIEPLAACGQGRRGADPTKNHDRQGRDQQPERFGQEDGRLANLRATAETALELLKEVTQQQAELATSSPTKQR